MNSIYNQRILHSWGIDGHNSHTNICSAGARTGYAFWHGIDRPSPDHANARFILLLSSHLEAGHYFNPHAQRIIDGKSARREDRVIDTRLSNTASNADYWLSTWPGSEAAVLLAMCLVILREGLYDLEFVRRWVNWEEYLREEHPGKPLTVETFIETLKEVYAEFTPEFAAKESGARAEAIVQVAREIGRAGHAFATHVWRNAAAGNLGGWQVARALEFLSVLVGAVGTEGGTAPAASNKFIPGAADDAARAQRLERTDVATRVPARVLRDELPAAALSEGRPRQARHVLHPRLQPGLDQSRRDDLDRDAERRDQDRTPCLPYADMERDRVVRRLRLADGPCVGTPRPDESGDSRRTMDRLSPAGAACRARKQGKRFNSTWEAHRAAGLGEVWEEDEFWIELSWRIDPDGALGIRKYFESPYRPGEKLTIEEYYRWIFENSVPGLARGRSREG